MGMMVNVSDKTEKFLRERKISDLDQILIGLKMIPVGDRDQILIDLVRIFQFSKSDLRKEFELICK